MVFQKLKAAWANHPDSKKLKQVQKSGRSIKRTPWKVDVRDRLIRVREDMEIAVRGFGWQITGMPACWAGDEETSNDSQCGAIELKPLSGTPEPLPGTADFSRMNEAKAVVAATFVYMTATMQTLRQSTQKWQRPVEWLTGGLLMSAYTSLHAAETSRILLLGSDQLAALLPVIRQRAIKYLPANDPRLQALQGLPDPTAPAHQALARVQTKLVETVTEAHASAQAQQNEGQAVAGSGGSTGVSGAPPNGSAVPAVDLVTLTAMIGRDQQIAAMAMGEATRAEDQQQAQVRRFRGVLLGTFLGLLIVVILLAILGSVHTAYFPLCVKSGTSVVCPTGNSVPGKADLAFIMAIGGIGAVLAVATNLTSLKPTGVRYSLSVAQGLIKIPFGAITAMLGVIILSTQSNVGVLATHAGLISTAAVFGYSQQLFTKFIDKRANDLLSQADGNG
jgi:hypothetical protein